jgi:hypothetical protein
MPTPMAMADFTRRERSSRKCPVSGIAAVGLLRDKEA